MECSCEYVSDGDYAKVATSKIVTARKSHTCTECGEEIKAGNKYERVDGLWDDDWETFKTCWICLKIRNDYLCSWNFGSVREDIKSVLGIDYMIAEI